MCLSKGFEEVTHEPWEKQTQSKKLMEFVGCNSLSIPSLNQLVLIVISKQVFPPAPPLSVRLLGSVYAWAFPCTHARGGHR